MAANSKNSRKRQLSEVEECSATSIADAEIEVGQNTKRPRVEERRSLFVRSLPAKVTNETLADFFSQHFPVKHAVVVVDQKTKESRGYGFVTLADVDDALAAKDTLDKAEWEGKHIRIDIAEPRKRKAVISDTAVPKKPGREEDRKPPKLIVRNLPWTIKTSEQLSNIFRSYGKVKFADLPQSKGKLRGFGFITIRGKKNAEKALESVNGKEIDGRTLAVDWAVDKETWEQQQNLEAEYGASSHENFHADEKTLSGSVASHDDDDNGTLAEPGKNTELNADLENFMKNHMQNMEDEDEDGGEDDSVDNDKPSVEKKGTDNSSTVFIRNLPFTTTDEQLKEFFSHFGAVRYARVVIDKSTEKPAGTGFVCFVKQSDAKRCIKEAPRPSASAARSKPSLLLDEKADPSGKYTLEGRLLQVAQAVNKAEAANLADNSLAKRREKDKRRLYLLSEGAIGRGSPLFGLLSPSEIQMRQASAAQRKKLVQSNPSLHLSLTRLALRNIPRNIGSKELKELARKAVVGFAVDVKEGLRQPLSKEENARDGKDAKEKERQRKLKGKGIVRQAKVVFESNQGSKVDETSGAGKSRGYGFIEYTSHHWALMGLRYLNGHQIQGENGRKQRLVVEFAIENANVVQRRRAAEKSVELQQEGRNKRSESADAGKGRSQRLERGGKGAKDGNREARAHVDDKQKHGASKAEDMQQRLIARTRLMRKKKAKARGKM
ncbi:RNA recognition motif containing protein [Metarhizium album ARSEF 1941]|uniref:RNA recognition motif containing protein n=1 Tax=Metarhizium album (strain ARSEF 1941) TaxID=1081103 RepID=A0A0B2WVL6_METAS|nr:RNA recognition motif containing protein [Metarhizium album ARSEF 1941]KHN97664.1 RNA recognition motif containing protein [Metarhizium album ARSEF 1941]